MNRLVFPGLVAIGLASCGDHPPITHPDQPASTSSLPAASNPGTVGPNADNSAINKGDGKGALTPLDQGSGDEDVKETADVRKAIVADKSLSINAQNIKI